MKERRISLTASVSPRRRVAVSPRLCMLALAVARADAVDVIARLSIRRHATAVSVNGTFASVVACEHQINSIVEAHKELLQIASSASYILHRVEGAAHAESRARSRH